MKENKLGYENVGKLLVKLAIPSILAQLVNMLYNLIDRIYIGHIQDIGTIALTGVGVTFPIIMIISAFSSLIGMGGAPRASIKLGENKKEDAEKYLGNSFTLLIIISIILTIVFLIFGEKLLFIFGASENTLIYAKDYLYIYVLGTIFVSITLGLNPFISAQGYAKTSMFTTLIGAIINIALDPIFIFTFDLGVKGAAIATVISQAISAIFVFVFLIKYSNLKLKLKHLKLKLSYVISTIKLGISPFIMQSTESLLMISLNSSLQNYGGDIAVGAMTVLSSVMQILILPLMGLTQGAQPLISYNYGAKKNDRVLKTFKFTLIAGMIYSIIFCLLTLIAPQIFTMMFSSDIELIDYTSNALRIYMSMSFVLGAQIICQQTFIAIGQAGVSLVLALLRKIILLIPLIYILPNFFNDKVFAIFLAEPISDFIAAATTVLVFALSIKKILKKNLSYA